MLVIAMKRGRLLAATHSGGKDLNLQPLGYEPKKVDWTLLSFQPIDCRLFRSIQARLPPALPQILSGRHT